MPITEHDDLTFSKNIKVFTEILFHKNKQILVVKSWQKILYQDLSVRFDLRKKSKSQLSAVIPKSRQIMSPDREESDNVSDNSAMLVIPDGFSQDRCFYVKTL